METPAHMSNSMRIGLVEVGSNTIRYLVADWSDMSFDPVQIETIKHGMHPSRPSEEAVAAVNKHVEAFVQDARGRDCDALLAYGTAACRAVAAQHPGRLSPLVKVLTPVEEATASWVAGFACTSRTPGTRCTVIDEGSGSTEIVSATWNGEALEGLAFHSVPIGSVALLEAYKGDAKAHVEHTINLIRSMTPEIARAGIAEGETGDLFLLGGVATSIGWQATKGTGLQEYRPAEINGAEVTMADLDGLHQRLFRLYKKDPAAARRAVDTRRGSEDHVLRVLSSLPFLTLLSAYLAPRSRYFISGYGVRHGMAFLIQHNLVPLDAA
jgi:exopolyphosphatase/pppGpp-phosphohydrolase